MADKKADLVEKAERMRQLVEEMIKSTEPVPCSPAMRAWWETKALPTLRDTALSSLRRHGSYPPHLIGFMDDGNLGIQNLGDMFAKMGHQWGDAVSKDITAKVHQMSAGIPGTIASVFCSEVWTLAANNPENAKIVDTRASIADHPEREEALMFSMLHFDWGRATMMQLTTMVPVLKVLGQNVSPEQWKHTTLGKESTIDPNSGEGKMEGRFIFGNKPDDDDA